MWQLQRPGPNCFLSTYSQSVVLLRSPLRRQGGQAGTRHRALSRDWRSVLFACSRLAAWLRCLETRCSSLGPGKTQRHLVAVDLTTTLLAQHPPLTKLRREVVDFNAQALPKWARTTSAAHRRSKNTLQACFGLAMLVGVCLSEPRCKPIVCPFENPWLGSAFTTAENLTPLNISR